MHPWTERLVATNGVTLRVLEAGEPGAPVVVLAHGFPELGYSWRHQIPVLAEAGYHVIAPDQRGYGGSSRPSAIEDYDITKLTGDIAGLLDAVGADRAVMVGHDWGSVVATSFALLYPDHVSGCVSLSVPPAPRTPAPPTEMWRNAFGDNFLYLQYFQEPGPADTELDGDPARALRRLFGGMKSVAGENIFLQMATPGPAGFIDRLPEPNGRPAWLSREAEDRYVAEFTAGGFTGPLNWYRNFDRNWELTATTPSAIIAVPTLFIGGADDPALALSPRDRVRDVVSGPYREVLIDDAGHWVQQEKPADVNAALIDFLAELRP